MGNQKLPSVKQAIHLGIIRTTSLNENILVNIEENIKKARRSAYDLFAKGFHGYNGLDIDTMVHLYNIYITPVLLPSGNQLNQLEMFQKRLLKHILLLPANVADVTIYILTGILPTEAHIHARALSFFNNFCHQSENSTEKVLARRQLALKSDSSSSWFIEVK